MSAPPHDPIAEVLRSVRLGESKLEDLAEALGRLDAVHVLPQLPETVAGAGDDVAAAAGAAAGIVGLTTPEGFVARVFTGQEEARAYSAGAGDGGVVVEPSTRRPPELLWEVLARNWLGIIIDDGSDHRLDLSRALVARLLALLTLREFTARPAHPVIVRGPAPLLQQAPGKPGMYAFAYTTRDWADQALQRIRARVPDAEVAELETEALLRFLLERGVTQLMVDASMPTARSYTTEDLARMETLIRIEPAEPPGPEEPEPSQPAMDSPRVAPHPFDGGGPAETASPPATQATLPATEASEPETQAAPPETQAAPPVPQAAPPLAQAEPPATQTAPPVSEPAPPAPEPEPPPAAAHATRYRTLPPVSPPARPALASEAHFQMLREKAEIEVIRQREYQESIAFDLGLFVPAGPRTAEGLTWPLAFRYPDENGRLAAYAYTRETDAKRPPAAGGEPPRVVYQLSGVEVLRWVWAAPELIEEIGIDRGSPRWTPVPAEWAITAIYPQAYELSALDAVENVGLVRLAKLPGARGLKPEVVRTLVERWRSLVPAATAGGEPMLLEHQGGRYLVVFTSTEQFFAYEQANPDFKGVPTPPVDSVPFGRWLEATLGLDGILLDPGPSPIPLDHTDLLLLGLWERQGGRQPLGGDIVTEAARLLRARVITPRHAARFVADWPRYFVLSPRADGLRPRPIGVPGGEHCALFTTAEKAEACEQAYRQSSHLTEETEIVVVVHRWDRSAFHQARDGFAAGAWIDPPPTADPEQLVAAADAGLKLDTGMLEAAIERIDERLKPRVPGFVAD